MPGFEDDGFSWTIVRPVHFLRYLIKQTVDIRIRFQRREIAAPVGVFAVLMGGAERFEPGVNFSHFRTPLLTPGEFSAAGVPL